MEFKVNNNLVLQKNFYKNLNYVFPKPNKNTKFFGVKYSKNKNVISFFAKNNLRFNFQEFNFTNENLVSVNRDLERNPFFGSISRGFSKLLVRVGLKEYANVFLRPRWYRISKFQSYKSIILKKKNQFDFFYKMFHNFNQKKNYGFTFFYQFFIKKRWILSNVLKDEKKI